MKLTELIQELKEKTGNGIPRSEIGELIDGRIELPEDFNPGHQSIEFTSMNYSREGGLKCHLLVSGHPVRTLDEIQPILDGLVARSKNLKIGKKKAEFKYGVLWEQGAFQKEKKLTGLFFDEVKVQSSVLTRDSTKVRIGRIGSRHEIEASTKDMTMTFKASGIYYKKLSNLAKKVGSQHATINLTHDDAERLLRAVRKDPISIYFANSLERVLQPKEEGVIQINMGGGISFGTKSVIEIKVQTNHLNKYEEIIGKSLRLGNQESKVTEYSKIYRIDRLLRGERISDLQYLAREIPKLDLGIIYDHPIITNKDAKDLLDEEINIMGDMFRNPEYWIQNSGMISPGNPFRSNSLKKIIEEHYGKEESGQIYSTIDQNESDFVGFLKQKGYEHVEIIANDSYPSWDDEKSEDARKEKHLLEFFKQSYAKDPRDSVSKFREFYKNSSPKLMITAESRGKDASKLSKLKFPRESRLHSFGITEHMVGEYSNDMAITRYPPSKDFHFFSRTSTDSPILLPLQEYACGEMGIKFR